MFHCVKFYMTMVCENFEEKKFNEKVRRKFLTRSRWAAISLRKLAGSWEAPAAGHFAHKSGLGGRSWGAGAPGTAGGGDRTGPDTGARPLLK